MKSKRKYSAFVIICAVALVLAMAVFICMHRPNQSLINPSGETIIKRFNPPEGFERVETAEGSFAHFLQNLPLLPDRSAVHYYDGKLKLDSKHEAVLAYELPEIDIEQCADVVMHLRAEYLYMQQRYDEIGFHFVSGFYCDFLTWSKGMRPSINGDEVTWINSAQPDSSRASFENYLRMVYSYASTLSLEKEMAPAEASELAIGDVFIIGGSPGHVVIVTDMAVNSDTGEKRFILLQGNMPSQQAHVIKNIFEPKSSPWFSDDFPEGKLVLGTWECPIENIKRFK